jgi:uncharacterized phage infection (PIP) family protein YhgE
MAQTMNSGKGANQQQMQRMQQAMQQAQQAANAQCQAGRMSQAAQQMAQAMQQAAQGAGGQAGQQMAQGQQQLSDMLSQLQAIQQDAQQMQAAQKALEDALAQAGGQCEGDKTGPGATGQWQAGDPNKRGRGQGGPGIGEGGAGQKDPAPFGTKAEHSKSNYDERGKHLASVFVKDQSVKGEAKLQLEKALQAGAADEGDDVDDSRADRRTQEVQKRYFKVMDDELKK